MHESNRSNRRFDDFRKSLLIALAAALLGSTAMAGTAPKAAVATPPAFSSSDRIFLADAASWNEKEIDISRYAAAHASSAKVREFAQMMVRDHVALGTDLHNVDIAILPPAPDTDPDPNLAYIKGAEFDKTYLGIIVADHDRTIAKFLVTSDNKLWSKPVRDAATKALPMLRRHEAAAKALDHGIAATR